MAEKVQFRRIGGRVVPIRSEVAKGAGAIAGGAALASATGRISSRLMHESAHAENQSRGLIKTYRGLQGGSPGPLFEHAVHEAKMKVGPLAIKAAAKSKRLERAAFGVRNGGTVAAAALFGYGANKLLNQTKLKDKPDAKAAVAGGATAVATFGVRSSYLRGVGMRGVKTFYHAFKRVVRAG